MIRSRLFALVMAAAAAPAAASSVAAQMPGQPVLQNAFVNHGWAFGVNYGDSDEALGYAAAVSWGSSSGKFGLAAGGGLVDPSVGDNAPAWGVRGVYAITQFGRRKALGLGAFAGIGGASRSGVDAVEIPFGASVGYRRALGETRGISVYVAPLFRLSRISADGQTDQHGLLRVSVGVDAAVFRSLGVTLGYEGGATAKAGQPGPGGGIFGAGVTYVLR